MDRRDLLKATIAAGGALAIDPRILHALQQGQLLQRRIPSTGEMLPSVGLGSSATFSQLARREELDALREVLRTLVDRGGSVFDTAPSYGASEQVAGDLANEIGYADKIFWATKVNVLRRGRGGDQNTSPTADPAAALAQINDSFEKFQVPVIDLIQVHNLADVPTQLGVLKELKAEGRVRYIGVTTTPRGNDYAEIEQVMRTEPIDFIGIDYAVDNRDVEESVLPLAMERGIGVLVYLPFGRSRLWARVGDRELPAWASEIDAATWAQFFIKYALSHPAVTVVTPATSKPHHLVDNLGAGMGRLPDESMRRRMAQYVDALPPAPAG